MQIDAKIKTGKKRLPLKNLQAIIKNPKKITFKFISNSCFREN